MVVVYKVYDNIAKYTFYVIISVIMIYFSKYSHEPRADRLKTGSFYEGVVSGRANPSTIDSMEGAALEARARALPGAIVRTIVGEVIDFSGSDDMNNDYVGYRGAYLAGILHIITKIGNERISITDVCDRAKVANRLYLDPEDAFSVDNQAMHQAVDDVDTMLAASVFAW